ncbi:hypothetical protein [Streptomyces sp. NPDC058758]
MNEPRRFPFLPASARTPRGPVRRPEDGRVPSSPAESVPVP